MTRSGEAGGESGRLVNNFCEAARPVLQHPQRHSKTRVVGSAGTADRVWLHRRSLSDHRRHNPAPWVTVRKLGLQSPKAKRKARSMTTPNDWLL